MYVKTGSSPPRLYYPVSPTGSLFIGSSRPAFAGFNFDFELTHRHYANIENERKKGVYSAILRAVGSGGRGG